MNLIRLINNNIFKNATSLSVNHGVQVLVQLLFIPIYLTYWDISTYSEWILISTIPGLLSISNFGLATYGLNSIVILSKQNKNNKANFVLQNIIFFTTAVSLCMGVVIFLLNFFFDFVNIFNIASVEVNNFYFILLFVFLKFLFVQINNFLSGLYRINHKFHISVYLKAFFEITKIFLIFTTLVFNGGIFEVSLMMFVNSILALLTSVILIKYEFKWVKIIYFKNIDFLYVRKIFYPSISFLVGSVNKGLIAQGTIIFLNYFSNDMLIIFYNSLRLILGGTRHFINIMSSSLQPELTINFAKKKFNKITNQFNYLIKYNFFIATIFLIILYLFTKEPFLIWTKNEIQWNFVFFAMLLIGNYVEWISIPFFTIPAAINKIEIYNLSFVITLILYFVLVFLLFPIQKILAIPTALLLTNLFAMIFNYLILKKQIKFFKNIK